MAFGSFIKFMLVVKQFCEAKHLIQTNVFYPWYMTTHATSLVLVWSHYQQTFCTTIVGKSFSLVCVVKRSIFFRISVVIISCLLFCSYCANFVILGSGNYLKALCSEQNLPAVFLLGFDYWAWLGPPRKSPIIVSCSASFSLSSLLLNISYSDRVYKQSELLNVAATRH